MTIRNKCAPTYLTASSWPTRRPTYTLPPPPSSKKKKTRAAHTVAWIVFFFFFPRYGLAHPRMNEKHKNLRFFCPLVSCLFILTPIPDTDTPIHLYQTTDTFFCLFSGNPPASPRRCNFAQNTNKIWLEKGVG